MYPLCGNLNFISYGKINFNSQIKKIFINN